MNARHSRSVTEPARPFAPQSRRADLPPLRENPSTSDFLEDTPFEEDLEERERNSPPRIRPMIRSTSNPLLNRTATSRYQQSPDDDYLMVPSSPGALTHSRTNPLSYRPAAPTRLGGTRHRGIQDDDALESLTHESELVSNTTERTAANSQRSVRRRPSYLPSFGRR